MNEISLAMLRTLLYSDLFSYPLAKQEVWTRFIHYEKIKKSVFESEWERLFPLLESDGRYYCVSGRRFLFAKRTQAERISQKKIQKAKKITRFLGFIPTIKLVGLSGSLSSGNAKVSDDIDFFIITSHNTLWLTRLLVLILLECLGVRRKKHDREVSDKACPNLFIDECFLALPSSQQNLYTAHEVVLMKPLFERDTMAQRFRAANRWVHSFLPNARLSAHVPKAHSGALFRIALLPVILSFLNLLAKKLQIRSIRKTATTEIVSDTMLAFYPQHRKNKIILRYQRLLLQMKPLFVQSHGMRTIPPPLSLSIPLQ